METGKIIKWRDAESSRGLTIGAMKASTSMTKRKGMAYSSGLTVGNTKENGRMGSSMALVTTAPLILLGVYTSTSQKQRKGQWAEGKRVAWL